MPDSPWKVKSLKRKSNQSTPTAATKRARLVNDVDHPSQQKQQTLTQIDFIQSPDVLVFKDGELQEIKEDKCHTTPSSSLSSSSRKRRRLEKRDSTLTQMDFFHTTPEDKEEEDYRMLPQVYGARCVQRESEGRRLNSRRESRNLDSRRRSTPSAVIEPCTQHTTANLGDKQLVKKGAVRAQSQTLDRARKSVCLDEAPTVHESDDDRKKAPNTPQRSRRSVASSQSPESLPPSTKRSKVSASKTFKRPPLEELSTNVRHPKSLNQRTSTWENKCRYYQASEADSIAVADFGDEPSSPVIPRSYADATRLRDDEPMLLGDDAVDVSQKFTEEDDTSDFGPDIANDTQFISNLFHDTSSPQCSSKNSVSVAPEYGSSLLQEASKRRPVSVHKIDKRARTSLPTPRLVQTSPLLRVEDQNQLVQPEVDLTLPGPLKSATSTVTITRVPLNDTLSSTQSPSPESPSNYPSTQPSIYPASIPHPSQISTQDPSQSHPQSSYALQSTIIHSGNSQGDRITITDSSSVSAYSSRTSAGRKPSTDFWYTSVVNDSEEEEDELDFDLDPPELHRQNSRKPQTTFVESETQTPTQETIRRNFREDQLQPSEISPSPSSSSLIVTHATTRAERDAKLEVIHLSPSQKPSKLIALSGGQQVDDASSQRNDLRSKILDKSSECADTYEDCTESQLPRQLPLSNSDDDLENGPPFCSPTSTISNLSSIGGRSPLKQKHSPIAGFDNDMQSNFAEDGHVTAAYIHREREAGHLPDWFTPELYQVKGWEKSKVSKIRNRKSWNEEKSNTCNQLLQWEQMQIEKNNCRPNRAEEKYWDMDFASSNASER